MFEMFQSHVGSVLVRGVQRNVDDHAAPTWLAWIDATDICSYFGFWSELGSSFCFWGCSTFVCVALRFGLATVPSVLASCFANE